MMEERTNDDVQKLDLHRLLQNFSRTLRKTWWCVVLLAVCLGCLQYYRAWKSYRPMYTASASLALKSSMVSTTDLVDTTQYYNSQAVEQVVSSFPYIISSEAMQERLRLALNANWVNGSIQATGVGDTNLFVLSVTSSSPQDAYDILLAVMDNYSQVASYVIGDTQLFLIEEPVVPTIPNQTFQGTGTAIKWGILGALLGLGLTMLLALCRKTVQGKDDLKNLTAVPCLGTLPFIRVKRRSKGTDGKVSVLNERLGDQLSAPVNGIQVQLLRRFRDTEEGARVILVTSTVPGEGKTTVSFNLAASLAQSGKEVILVDADLRHQVIKERIGITTPSAGLLELSRAPMPDVSRVLIPVEGTSLRLLAGDNRIASPMSILDSAKMRGILRQTRSLADYVIIDAPPAGILADASVLCRSADQVLYVVRYDGIPQSQIAEGLHSLSGRGKLAGYVINGVPHSKGSGYGYGYGYGYGKYGYGGKRYGYGSASGEKSRTKKSKS